MPPQLVDADDVISLDSFSFEDGVTGRGVELDDSGGGFAAADISLWGLSVSSCCLRCALILGVVCYRRKHFLIGALNAPARLLPAWNHILFCKM